MSDGAGRNDPCKCGSGKKFKKCCLAKQQVAARAEAKAYREAPPPPPPAEDEEDGDAKGKKHEHGPGCSHGKH